jgi:hypothetical protein
MTKCKGEGPTNLSMRRRAVVVASTKTGSKPTERTYNIIQNGFL